jgi:hypothetical protein
MFRGVVGEQPAEVTPPDVFPFLASGWCVWRTGSLGWPPARSPTAVERARLVCRPGAARGDIGVVCNPVPTSLAARRPGGEGGVPLISTPRTPRRVVGAGRGRRAGAGAAHPPGSGEGRGDDAQWLRRCGCLACAWRTSTRASGGCSSRAKVGRSGSRPCRPEPSDRWPTTWNGSARRLQAPRALRGAEGCRRGVPLSAEGMDEILQPRLEQAADRRSPTRGPDRSRWAVSQVLAVPSLTLGRVVRSEVNGEERRGNQRLVRPSHGRSLAAVA